MNAIKPGVEHLLPAHLLNRQQRRAMHPHPRLHNRKGQPIETFREYLTRKRIAVSYVLVTMASWDSAMRGRGAKH